MSAFDDHLAGLPPPPRASLPLLLRTIRHLRPGQLIGQLAARLPVPLPLASHAHRVPLYPGCRWPSDRVLPPPAGGAANDPAQLLDGVFTFLNDSRSIGWPPDWRATNTPLLWQFNLHYFEWLWALGFDDARHATRDWLTHADPASCPVAWRAYPVSLRLINWLGVFWGKYRAELEADEPFLADLWQSVCRQADSLSGNLETHILGNHLLENGAALALVGSCFSGERAEDWATTGRTVLEREIPEQFLPDGLHFERSPMYHLRALYLLLALRQQLGADALPAVDASLPPALAALRALCHPDGQIALFNDAALGIYNEPADLLALSSSFSGADPPASPPLGPWSLPDAGYYGFRDTNGNYICCDAGPVGPDYQPGHAHGDIFSFELSLGGERVIVDSGVHDYETSPMRRYSRSTAAHNTVEIDGEDQCEFWGAFYVARRGRPRDVDWQPTSDGFTLAGRHDGYERLPGRPRHHRQFTWTSDPSLTITDRVISDKPVAAASRLHLHPSCAIESLSANAAEVAYPGGRLRVTVSGDGELTTEPSAYCPRFGQKLENTALVIRAEGTDLRTDLHLACTSSALP